MKLLIYIWYTKCLPNLRDYLLSHLDYYKLHKRMLYTVIKTIQELVLSSVSLIIITKWFFLGFILKFGIQSRSSSNVDFTTSGREISRNSFIKCNLISQSFPILASWLAVIFPTVCMGKNKITLLERWTIWSWHVGSVKVLLFCC